MHRGRQSFAHQTEIHELPTFLACDQAGFLKEPQVIGQRGLAEVEALGDVSSGELTTIEIRQNLAARR